MSLAALAAAGVAAVLAPAWLVGLTGAEGGWQIGVAWPSREPLGGRRRLARARARAGIAFSTKEAIMTHRTWRTMAVGGLLALAAAFTLGSAPAAAQEQQASLVPSFPNG